MSDLADAIFSGQLTGHLISGEEIDSNSIIDAAIKADLASHMVADDGVLSGTEKAILEAKVAHAVATDGHYDEGELLNDHLHAHLDLQLIDHFLS